VVGILQRGDGRAVCPGQAVKRVAGADDVRRDRRRGRESPGSTDRNGHRHRDRTRGRRRLERRRRRDPRPGAGTGRGSVGNQQNGAGSKLRGVVQTVRLGEDRDGDAEVPGDTVEGVVARNRIPLRRPGGRRDGQDQSQDGRDRCCDAHAPLSPTGPGLKKLSDLCPGPACRRPEQLRCDGQFPDRTVNAFARQRMGEFGPTFGE